MNSLRIGKWIPSPNWGYPRGTKGYIKRVAIVDHVMDGFMVGTRSKFLNAASLASAHIGVSRKGEFEQYVDFDNAAWAHGKVNNPSWPLLIPNLNPNKYTISIEHEGYSGQPLTEEQYQATLWLHKVLCAAYDIVPGPDTIIGHYRIDSVNRANCPGPAFPFGRLLEDLEPRIIAKYHDAVNKALWYTLQAKAVLESVRPR